MWVDPSAENVGICTGDCFFNVLTVLYTALLQVTMTLLCTNRGMKPVSTDGIRAKRLDCYRSYAFRNTHHISSRIRPLFEIL